SRLVLAHLIVELLTIPLICGSLWAGNWLAYAALGPVEPKEPPKELREQVESLERRKRAMLDLFGPLAGLPESPKEPPKLDPDKLRVDPMAFGPALVSVAALIFAVGGFTMALSARGHSR